MTVQDEIANALANPKPPQFDLVGPTVDDDIRRAIGRYGSEAVKAAVKRQTKAKIGRPKLNDWRELAPVIEEHAHLWLNGGDPFSAYSNYSIAKTFAASNPGQSAVATHKRIERKLKASRHGRKWYTLVIAYQCSEDSYPHAAHIRTLEALCELDPQFSAWRWHLDRANGSIADYAQLNGAPPRAQLTMKQVEEGAKPPNALLGYISSQRRGGMFGLAGPVQR